MSLFSVDSESDKKYQGIVKKRAAFDLLKEIAGYRRELLRLREEDGKDYKKLETAIKVREACKDQCLDNIFRCLDSWAVQALKKVRKGDR